jgi:hypothetical protein
MPSLAYIITRLEDGSIRALVSKGPRSARFPLRHICYHSPTGFEIGYGGSGPADLALSILTRHFRESGRIPVPSRSKAWRYHQEFKRDALTGIDLRPGESHVITGIEINQWLAARTPAGAEH